MSSRLVPCGGCRRHVYATEQRCPFCSEAVLVVAEASHLPSRMSRAAQVAWAITLGGASLGACASPGPRQAEGVAVVPTDASTASPELAVVESDAAAEAPAEPPLEDPHRPHLVIPMYGQTITVVQHLRFPRGSDAVEKADEPTLDAVAEVLRENPTLLLLIEGHAAEGEAGATKLSQARAVRVGAALAKRGVSKSRLRTKALGSSSPRDAPRSSAENRRVEFRIQDPALFADAGAPLP